MKKITLYLFLSMVIAFSAEAHKYNKAKVTISIQTFYDQLSPYGDWIYSPDYGYVWRPYFDRPESFRPYSSNGNWVYTDYGWTWASGYDWGWATFHYGRWDFDNYLGWLWIPGYEWAPAWVSWGSYDNYWGWAPLGPNIFVQYNSNWYAPDPWWTFVARDHFCAGNWNRYIYNRPVNVTHITHITNVYVDNNNRNNHNSWYNGPRVTDVEKYNRSKVNRVEIGDSRRPGKSDIHNNRLDIYRPTVDNSRKDSRPTEYRNVSQARTGNRIEQTNAHTNDPGVNRTRENGQGPRTFTPKPVQRNDNATRETRVETRTSTQTSGSRTIDSRTGSVETPRNTSQAEQRNSSINRGSGNDTRNASQASPVRNSNRQPVDNKRETPDRYNNTIATEGRSDMQNNNRVVNPEVNRPVNNVPARENANNTISRESQQKQTPATQPTREQRTQNARSSSNSRIQNTETPKASNEDVKKESNESKKEVKSSENRSSKNPSRR